MGRKKVWGKVDWQEAPDIKRKIDILITSLKLGWIEKERIFCIRSTTSSSRAYARIWGLSRIWQIVLASKPAYIIEVLGNKFDNLSEKEQNKILLHEIAHIPKNFSGSLVPHIKTRGNRNFNDKVAKLIVQYKNIKK